MAEKNDGGAAFPRSPHSGEQTDDGMSLRDYFAARALHGMLSNSHTMRNVDKASERHIDTTDVLTLVREQQSNLSIIAYGFADAMLAAREAR